MDRAELTGQTVLLVEEQPIVAIDLKTALEDAGAEVVIARDAAEALASIGKVAFTAAVLDLRPSSDEHRTIARALNKRGVRFVFHATEPPEDVTTVRGAPVFQKPTRAQDIVKALAGLIGPRK
jgi:ActR/RegA family two-component response regulator